jgi:tryptophan halogenase
MKIIVLGAGTAGLVAALMLREKYPLCPIAVVKSGEIGIIGVGEGSTEHWVKFMDYIGLSVEEVVFNTRATIKIGILFKDWNVGEEYIHSIHQNPFSKHARMDLYHQFLSQNTSNVKFPLAPMFEHVFYNKNVPMRPDFKVSNQYHFDTFKLNEYLLQKCTERNISIVDTKVTDASICPTTGNITELIAENGSIKADFFIDCSGFKKVLASKLNNKWVSKTEFLPMNHAIAFPTERDSNADIEPYTTTTALSSGWAWRIPTQDRYGNGYVFNDNYVNADQALSEISKSLNINVEKVARDIKFEAGKVDKFWCKNVVSVGLCGSFAEPLEAQSIGFTVVQMFALLEHLDTWQVYEPTVKNYNLLMDDVFNNVIDYLQLHYFVRRNDTKFWQDKPFTYTNFNADTCEAFKHGINNLSMFKHNRFNMFGPANWFQVMYGIGLLDKESILKKSKSNSYKNKFKAEMEEWVNNEIQEAKNMPTISHKEFLNCVNNYYIKKYEN